MPKRLKDKKPAKKPAATKRPSSDPNRRAGQLMAEHLAKMDEGKWKDAPAAPDAPVDFETAFRQRMAELGRKGGQKGGKRRLETMSAAKRKAVAKKAAKARWKKKCH